MTEKIAITDYHALKENARFDLGAGTRQPQFLGDKMRLSGFFYDIYQIALSSSGDGSSPGANE